MADIITTKELAEYLKLHEITILKHVAKGQIPAIRIGRVWRFDKEVIDEWISGGLEKTEAVYESRKKAPHKPGERQ